MKNLVKNALRSLKNNKVSVIGLVFLIFFGLGAFCTMQNTTSNIKNEYTSISNQGNLHDFSAAELYDVGNPGYTPKSEGIKYDVDAATYTPMTVEQFATVQGLSVNNLYHDTGVPTQSGVYYIPVPLAEKFGDSDPTKPQTYARTYNVFLNKDISTGLYAKFADNKSKTAITNFKIRVSETYDNDNLVPSVIKSYTAWYKKASPRPSFDMSWNVFEHDYNKFMEDISAQTQNIFNVMTTSDTPLALELSSKEYVNDLTFRFFKSINITATDDKIFYKVINSNVEDQIDKIVLFKDSNKRTGNNLFSINDWAPYGSEIIFYDKSGNVYTPKSPELTNIKVPFNFNDVALTQLKSYDELAHYSEEERIVYSQIMQIRFKRMLAGNRTTSKKATDNLLPLLVALSSTKSSVAEYYTNFYTEGSELRTAYQTYLERWNQGYGESVTISANGNIVFQWVETLGTPQSCTLTNWTSAFSVVNPQHMQSVGKSVVDPSILNNFAPYKEWYAQTYGSEPKGEISNLDAKKWFNTLDDEQFRFWVSPSKTGLSEKVYTMPNGRKITVVGGTGQGKWSGIDPTNISPCGGNNQIIWGCGISPDFMFPVVDISRPTPNSNTETLVYCNTAGYNKIKLAFVNSPVEEYLIGKFSSNLSQSRKNEIINHINDWAKTNMIWPKGVKCAYLANDASNVLNCSGFRIAYIPNLVKTIDIVSAIMCSFIGLLALIICFVIIKRYVERNRINIGIMRANGISKLKIALSLFPFALIPAIIGGIGAYILGFSLQAPALSLFKHYWTLPTPLVAFDWLSMLICVIAPFLIFGLISFIATMIVLRTKSVELMKAGSEFKTNGFSRIVKKPFKHFGILTRFRVSLAFNSISRLLMMSAMSCLTMSSLVFAFTTFDKLNKSRAINSSQFDYSFSLQLTTPTASGSTYSTFDYSGENARFGAVDPSQYLYNINWDTSAEEGSDTYKQFTRWYADGSNWQEIIGKSGNLMLPNSSDMKGQNQDVFYLADKVCSKFTLDYNLGASFIGATSNPWEIALALMPANSRNLAADAFTKVISAVGSNIEKANATFKASKEAGKTSQQAAADAGKWYNWNGLEDYPANLFDDYITKKDGTYALAVHDWLTGFDQAFTKLVVTMYNDPSIMKLEYPIMYRQIPINWEVTPDGKKDELYTYIEAKINSLSTPAKFDNSQTIKIEGIKENSQYINLTNSRGEPINSLLFDEDESNSRTYPLIVNSYVAHKYKLKIGSTIEVKVDNMVDRYERKIHPEQYKDDSNIAKFKVVEISVGTNGEAFYTTQMAANKIIGLPDGYSWNKTHRYMLWQEQPGWTADVPQVVDLAGLDSNSISSMTRYTFNSNDQEFKQPKVDFDVQKKNMTPPVGFNGIYTSNKSGKPLTTGISLYSYTGMYLGTSVHKTSGSVNKFAEILMCDGTANLSIANLLTGIKDPKYYQACNDYLNNRMSATEYRAIVDEFVKIVAQVYGDTTMITSICGAMDVAASDLVYTNLINTFNLAESSIMAIIIPITIIIVGIISNLIIIDSKKMAAMLKALGYSDAKNLMSILALFIPTIVLGLALAIPLSIGLAAGYQSIIFTSANILVDVSQKWWYYLAGVGGIGIILIGSYAIGYASLKRNRLVDEIK